MTKLGARIILDSINDYGDRLTTMEVTMHRFVLAEFNTHRVFSRNSASSRAIPVTKRLAEVGADPCNPIAWPREQPGMQGGENLEGGDLQDAHVLWQNVRTAVFDAVDEYVSKHAPEHRLHKSVINRLLEPFLSHTVIVSSTEWENFFSQRCSPLAQPEIRVVAEEMQAAYAASQPELVSRFDWHKPYLDDSDRELSQLDQIKVSVARCARVSYLTHDGKADTTKDIELFDKLVTANPPHWSPLEHIAQPARIWEPVKGNFMGWHQLRHLW